MKLFLDKLLILCGCFLTPWSLYKWHEIGFQFESKFYAGNRDGSFFLIVTLLGIGLVSYGFLNILIFRRKDKSSKLES